MSVSILIINKGGGKSLPRCLESVRWSDDVHVLDSSSSDHTLEIAAEYGAKVTRQVEGDRATQLNAALDGIPFMYPWLLLIEADEQVTRGLSAELSLMGSHLGPQLAYRIRRCRLVAGILQQSNRSDTHPVRYFSWDSVRFSGGDEAIPVVEGPMGELEAAIAYDACDQESPRKQVSGAAEPGRRRPLRNTPRLLESCRSLLLRFVCVRKQPDACESKASGFGMAARARESSDGRLCL